MERFLEDIEEGRTLGRDITFLVGFIAVFLAVAWVLMSQLGVLDDKVEDTGDYALVYVPNVVGLSEAAAAQALRTAGFEVEPMPKIDIYSEAGVVTGQSPEGGAEAAPGVTVTIEVATRERPDATVDEGDEGGIFGDRPNMVPDVVGRSRQSAESLLDNGGYDARVSEVYDRSMPEGKVVAQSPEGGTELDAGGEVRILVSLGSPPDGAIEVPSVLGLSESSAVARIEGAGLEAYTFPRPGPRGAQGKAFHQWPEGGALVDQGTLVYVMIGLR